MSRITRKTLDTLLGYVATKAGVRQGHYEKVNGKYQPIANGLELDHNSCYGGYEVQQIDGNGGTGITVVSGGRKSASEMYAWLHGFLATSHIRGSE
jgi:hypothetical protein